MAGGTSSHPSRPSSGHDAGTRIGTVGVICCEVATLSLAIRAENGSDAPCRFIARSKSRRYKAIGTPSGGTYAWTVTGGASISSGAAAQIVEIRGDTTSAALDDVTLTVTYRCGSNSARANINLTVYEVRRIDARLLRTPCWRRSTRRVYNRTRSSTADSKTFDDTAVTICRGCGDLELTGTVEPAAVPLAWMLERAADDVGLAGLPTHAANGSDKRHKVTADAVGSFHVIAFVDCNGDGIREANDGAIILNVHIVDIEVIPGVANNRIFRRTTHLSDALSTAATLIVHSGTTNGFAPKVNASYGRAEMARHPLAMEVRVKLIGGGANNRRGTNKVRCGFIQIGRRSTIRGTYADGRTIREVVVRNTATPYHIVGGAPALRGYPIRDTRFNSEHGTGPFIISSSDVRGRRELPGGGLQRIVRFVDPPAIAIPYRHPATGSALASISGLNRFTAFLSAYSRDFDRNYVVVASARWAISFGTYSAAAGWSRAGARVSGGNQMTVNSPPIRVQDTNAKRCPPNFVDRLRMDAR